MQTIQNTASDTGELIVVQNVEPNLPFYRPLADQTPMQMMERLQNLTSFTWATSDTVSTTTPWKVFRPFPLLMATQPTASFLTQFLYFRSDMEIHFRFNTNQFYAGAMMISAAPFACPVPGSSNPAAAFLQARSWLKPKIMSAQKQDTVIIQLPWTMAQRMVTPATITGGDEPWTLFVDVLTPLRVASPNAPTSITVTVQARWVNPQLVFPYQANPPLPQSGRAKPPVQRARLPPKVKGHRVVVSRGASTKPTPAAQAAAPPPPEKLCVAGSMVSGVKALIGDFGGIAELMGKLQPLIPVAMQVLAMLDKPEEELSVTRIYDDLGTNMVSVDTNDQSIPLTLYKTSYLAIDPEIMPDGRHWTIAEVAMTPALHSSASFSTAGTLSTVIPYLANGTPFYACMTQHALWRGSVRMQFQFYCPMFVSARFLITISPVGVAATGLNNNVSRLVDVKGDTTVSMTFPFIYPLDMANVLAMPYQINVAVYNNIVTSDVTADPYIDMIVWSAAGPDAQFSYIQGGDFAYTWPNVSDLDVDSRVVPQCDIIADFGGEFEPFVIGSSYLTDQKTVTSEVTVYVTDILKRYIGASVVLPSNTQLTLPQIFTPNTQSAQYFFANMFAFHRGGIRYKSIKLPIVEDDYSVRAMGFTTAGPDNADYGWPDLVSGPTASSTDVSIPYVSRFPFQQYVGTQAHQPIVQPMFQTVGSIAATSNPNWDDVAYGFYTAYRDDVQLGYLVPPPQISGGLKRVTDQCLRVPVSDDRQQARLSTPPSISSPSYWKSESDSDGFSKI